MRCTNQRALPILLALFLVSISGFSHAQQTVSPESDEQLRQTVRDLVQRVSVLEKELREERAATAALTSATPAGAATAAKGSAAADLRNDVEDASSSTAASTAPASTPGGSTLPGAGTTSPQTPVASVLPAQLPGGATLNYALDGYYQYDFNHPIGRVEYLRAYDVLSNAFSINQANIIFALDPDLEAHRRYGIRVDLQFGQATATLQGNPTNEARPDIYRNIFQAYGTYVFPLGRGLTVDVGKWASSLGIEGNYSKDQINYSRSFYFSFLPFYHAGIRTSYKVNDRLSLNYWLVNGTNQTEPTNSFKDELFGFAAQPAKNVSWTVNYYLGQDHPDSEPATDCTVPLQPGLCLQQISPAPNGKTHIFDSYVTWNTTPKLTMALEGDYVISRLWANPAPGESSAPSHVDGGAAYARYQLSPKMAVAARTEYLSDRGGLYSGTTQALKEFTGTYEYRVADGLLARGEFRRDWSNVPYFLTAQPGQLSPSQPTFTVGLIWWYGGKQGTW